jgi:drug/metabolite transporter (DMT)-like permease
VEADMTLAVRAHPSGSAPAGLGAALRSPVLALTLAALFWAGNFVVARAVRDDVDPVLVTFVRWFLALLILLPFVWRDVRRSLPAIRREWRLLTALGLTGLALFHPLVFLAVRYTTATNALITLSLVPVAIMLGAGLLARKTLSAYQLGGALISLSGAMVLITRGDLAGVLAAGFNVGDLVMLVAVVVWAVYSLLLRRRPADLSPTVTLVASIVPALPVLLAFTLAAGPAVAMSVSPSLVAAVLYMAIFATVLSFMFWSYGVAELGPSRAGQFVQLMPVFGAALAFVFLGEPLSMPQLAGAGLVLGGIVLVENRRAPQPA